LSGDYLRSADQHSDDGPTEPAEQHDCRRAVQGPHTRGSAIPGARPVGHYLDVLIAARCDRRTLSHYRPPRGCHVANNEHRETSKSGDDVTAATVFIATQYYYRTTPAPAAALQRRANRRHTAVSVDVTTLSLPTDTIYYVGEPTLSKFCQDVCVCIAQNSYLLWVFLNVHPPDDNEGQSRSIFCALSDAEILRSLNVRIKCFPVDL